MDKSQATKVFFGLGALVIIAGIIYYFKKGIDSLNNIDFYVTKVRLPKVSLTSATIDATIKLMNPSELGFTVKSYKINVGINGRFVATLNGSGLAISIAPKSDVDIPLSVTFDPRRLGVQVGLLLLDVYSASNKDEFSKNLEINYKGSLSGEFAGFNLTDIPIDYTYKFGQE